MCFDIFQCRHLTIALGMILSLVKSFGAAISSALLAMPPVGVDLEAEQRYFPPFISLMKWILLLASNAYNRLASLVHILLGWSGAVYVTKS